MSVASAWILSIIGFVVAFIIALAGAMRSVPRLSLTEAAVGVPVPLIAAAVAAYALVGATRNKKTVRAVLAIIPLGLSLLTLLFIFATWLARPVH